MLSGSEERQRDVQLAGLFVGRRAMSQAPSAACRAMTMCSPIAPLSVRLSRQGCFSAAMNCSSSGWFPVVLRDVGDHRWRRRTQSACAPPQPPASTAPATAGFHPSGLREIRQPIVHVERAGQHIDEHRRHKRLGLEDAMGVQLGVAELAGDRVRPRGASGHTDGPGRRENRRADGSGRTTP